MKKRITGIIILAILILGVIYFFIRIRPDETITNIVDVNSLASSTILTNLNSQIAANNSNGQVDTAPAENQKEQAGELVFNCADSKTIDAIIYTGGKDPRADITLIDRSQGSGAETNESRRLILKQKPAVTGLRYATDQETIVFTITEREGKVIENNRMIFGNCHMDNKE